MEPTNRRSFFRLLFGAAAAAPVVALVKPARKPTGGLFDPIQNLAAQWKNRGPIGDTIHVKKPMRFVYDAPRELVEDAMRSIGALLPGETASPDDFEYCSRVARRTVAQWRSIAPHMEPTERMLVRALAAEIAPAYFTPPRAAFPAPASSIASPDSGSLQVLD